MSAGWRAWGACRALALRPRPALRPRAEAFWQTTRATRFYSDDVNGHPSQPNRPEETPRDPRADKTSDDADSSTENVAQKSSIPTGPEDVVQESPSPPVEPPPFNLGRCHR